MNAQINARWITPDANSTADQVWNDAASRIASLESQVQPYAHATVEQNLYWVHQAKQTHRTREIAVTTRASSSPDEASGTFPAEPTAYEYDYSTYTFLALEAYERDVLSEKEPELAFYAIDIDKKLLLKIEGTLLGLGVQEAKDMWEVLRTTFGGNVSRLQSLLGQLARDPLNKQLQKMIEQELNVIRRKIGGELLEALEKKFGKVIAKKMAKKMLRAIAARLLGGIGIALTLAELGITLVQQEADVTII